MTTALALDRDPVDLELRLAIYGRQSKGKTASIEEQLHLGRARASHQGWPVAGVLSDAISASRFAGRERGDWPKLIGLVEAGQVDAVWLWETSRGDRKLSTWAAFLELCQDQAVYIWVESHGRLYDMRNPRDMRTMGEEGTDNVHESAKIQDRTMRAKDAARREGALRTVLGGAPPAGFQDGPDDWETHLPVANVLRDVAARVIRGESVSEAFREQPEVWTPAYGKVPARRVTEKMVRAALQRPVTAGLMTAQDGTIIREVLDDPPLDVQTWRKVQAVFATRKRGRRPRDQFVFGKVLTCGVCGNQLTGGQQYYRDRPPKPVYTCKVPHPGHPKPCRGVSIDAGAVELLLRAAVEGWAEGSARFAAASAVQSAVPAERDRLAADLAERQDWLADLIDKRNAGQLSAARYGTAEAELTRQIGEIQDQLTALADLEAHPLPAEVNWPGLTGPERRRLVSEALITPIVVEPGKGGARPLSPRDRLKLHVRG